MITNQNYFQEKESDQKTVLDAGLYIFAEKTYSELRKISEFKDKLQYLKLPGSVGEETFGWERYINQQFYKSSEWRRLRNEVIVRDMGLDLGCEGWEIRGHIIVHHMNPIRPEDILNKSKFLLNPEYLICCSIQTHNAIHYSDESILCNEWVARKPGDTKLW